MATPIGGHLLSALQFLLWLIGLLTLHFTLVAGLSFAASALIMTLTTLLRPAGSAPAPGTVWQPVMAIPEIPQGQRRPGWTDYRVQALVLLLLTLLLVLSFA